jgi:hypothetical protein
MQETLNNDLRKVTTFAGILFGLVCCLNWYLLGEHTVWICMLSSTQVANETYYVTRNKVLKINLISR